MKHAFFMLAFLFVVNVSFAQNVEVLGDLKLVNGTQGEGKVLVSDEDGVASWVTKESLVIELHKNLPGGLKRLVQWGVSPVDLWASGVPYDSIIGLNISEDINFDEFIFYVDTLDIHPFSALITGKSSTTYGVWGCTGAINGADGTSIGDGSQNSTDVRNQCPAGSPNSNIIFWQSFYNAGPNWYIASTDEALMIYDLLISPGIYDPLDGLTSSFWISSEAQGANEATHAMNIDVTTGVISERLKTHFLRAITMRQIPD